MGAYASSKQRNETPWGINFPVSSTLNIEQDTHPVGDGAVPKHRLLAASDEKRVDQRQYIRRNILSLSKQEDRFEGA